MKQVVIKIFCVIILMQSGANLMAKEPTGSIEGVIKMNNGLAAVAATVSIVGTNIRTHTNAKGQFRFAHINLGKHKLIISLVGCKTAVKNINITQAKALHLSITLQSVSNLLNEIVVTGQYTPRSLKNTVYKVRVISHKTIEQRSATNILEVLNSELGIQFSTDLALGETDIQLMGMSGQNVKVLLDGVPLIDRNGTKQSLSQIDINSVDRIEIVEGPMSVMYGTDALAGVINIITKKNNQKSGLSINARIQEETVGDEYNGWKNKGLHNESLNANWHKDNWRANFSVTRNNFGGWQGAKTGRAKEWMPKQQWLSNAGVAYHKNKFSLYYKLYYLNETLNALGDVNPNTNVATDQDFITNRYTHIAQMNWQVSDRWRIKTAASYQDYARATQTSTLDMQTDERLLYIGDGTQDVSKFKSIFLRTTAQYILNDKISFQPGVEYQRDNANGQRIVDNPHINNYAFFLSSEIKPTKAISVRPGVRISKNSTYDAPPLIPSLNTMYKINEHFTLRMAYGHGFRAPALRELYFSFFDASHSIKGNPNLKAEHSNSFNGSLSWHADKNNKLQLSSTVSTFYNHFTNRISLALGTDQNNNNIYSYVNIDEFKTIGATWENRIQWQQLQASLGLSYIGSYNQLKSDTGIAAVGKMKTYNWNVELNAKLIYSLIRAKMTIGLFYKYTGKRPQYELTTDNAIHLAKTSTFSWADLNINKKINSHIAISAGVKNLFDITTLQNTASNSSGAHSSGTIVPMSYGRSYFVGLNIHWNKQ